MPNQYIKIEELTKKRTPSELHSWVEWKIKQVGSTDEGAKALTLHEGLAKQLMEEVCPLALFGVRKFGDTNQVLMQPVIGDQSYDATVTDLRNEPTTLSYVEITQSHEGESEYLHSVVLNSQGYDFPHSPIRKIGTKKTGIQVSTRAEAFEFGEIARKELEKIADAAERKAGKDYPTNTWLIIVFDDGLPFQKAIDVSSLDAFIKRDILKLDLRFSALYLIGWHTILREFSLGKST